MNKKILLLGLVVLGIVMCTSLVSAYTPYYYQPRSYESLNCVNCGAMPYTPTISTYRYQYQPQMPVRIGGFFGQSSSYIIGLKPGTYYETPCIQRSSFFYQPCNTGGYRGYYGGYGNYYGGGYYGNYYGNYYGYGGSYPSASYMYHGPM